MNPIMTRLTQNPQVIDDVVGMTPVNMVDEKLSILCLAHETFMRIVVKSSLSIHSRALSVVRIVCVTPLKRVKNSLFTIVTTKFRRFATGFLGFIRFPAVLTDFCDKRVELFTSMSPAVSGTIENFSRHITRCLTWDAFEGLTTKFTRKLNLFVARLIVALSGAEGSSPLFKNKTACWTLLHTPQSNINNC